MTNGEKFKEIFKLSQVDECDLNVYAWLPIHDAIEIPLEWWNAEYQEPTTKNDLGVDAVSRKAVINQIFYSTDNNGDVVLGSDLRRRIEKLPPVTPQEPFKPMVEIDLYSVIKQKYIEREVFDKIRAEIETKYGQCKLTEYIVQYDGICTSANDIGDIADILQIIDKYKVESEG